MKKTTKDQLTPKEEEVMQLLWEHGPILISTLVELYLTRNHISIQCRLLCADLRQKDLSRIMK